MNHEISKVAQDAIDVQDACNPRGVTHSMLEAMRYLADQGCGTNEICLHPVISLYVSKLASLNNSDCLCDHCLDRFHVAMEACKKLAALEVLSR